MSHTRLKTACTLSWILLIVFCAVSVQAQSGRRQTKPTPAAPIPTPTPEPTPVPKKEDKEPQILFFVRPDRFSSYQGFPITFYDAVLRGCADRLRAASSATVDVSDHDLSRGEAIKKAKSDDKTYVVLLTLKFDSMQNTSDDIQLEFVAFAPKTAKVVTTGRTYPNDRRIPVIVDRTGRGLYRELLLRQAGEDAANRILKALNLVVPK